LALTKIEASNIAAGAVASSGFIGYTVYTGGATWLKSANTPTKIVVEVVGGGGSSGSGATGWGFGGSGGAGGYVRKFIDVTLLTSATIVIGAGGIKNEGTSAGNSSWTDNLGTNTLVGGLGGNGINATATPTYGDGGAAGAATSGDVNIPGSAGTEGNLKNAMATTGSFLSSGNTPGFGSTTDAYGAAAVGKPYGGGASQGRGNNATVDGANGGVGVVIVWEYK